MEIEHDNAVAAAAAAVEDGGCGAVATGAGAGMYMVWEEVTAVLPNFASAGPTRRLLNGNTGYAEPGRILAIMGPSGSGKSTLLDALSGRLSGNVVMTGSVLLNGKKRRLNYGGVAYVTQEDIMLGTLTVRETISYSAYLRLPSSMTNEDINGIVEGAIMEMGLQDCADQLIGNWHLRGISGGEKKRLSIALEILTRPQLLFLDEPTSGLDSAAAFFVVKILKNIAHDGRTVISSIHQPSSEVFALFDDLLLLSGGETVYFGEAKSATKFFSEAGFPCPTRRNPSDHFLQCINSDFDVITEVLMESQRLCEIQNPLDPIRNLPTSEIKGMLINKYRCSEYAIRARGRIRGISSIEGLEHERKSGSQATWLKQLSMLTQRSVLNMSRDFGYYWLRIAIYIILAVSVGSVFYDVGTNYTAIYARGSCAAFISGFMTFMSIGGFPSFMEELKVFYRERLNGHYGVAVYTISNFLSSIPFVTAMSFATSSITYYMVKFRPGVSHFIYAGLDLTSSIAVIEGCMMMIAAIVPNFITGIVIGAGYLAIMLITSGYFRLIPEIPKVFWRYPVSYINHGAWGLQGAYKNDLIGLEFDALGQDGPKLKGDIILKTMLGMNLDHSKWWDLAAVVALLVAYRVLFFSLLKFREKASPVFRSVYAKRTLHHLKKRPSFRKMAPFSSKRHQVLHSLSSQEGLQSPMH